MYQLVPGTAGARKLGWDKARFFLWETGCRKGFPLESSRECALPTLWPQPSRLHNCDRTCFCCWSHPTCGNGSYRELIQCAGPQEDSWSSILLGWIDEHLNYVAAFCVPWCDLCVPCVKPESLTEHKPWGREEVTCLPQVFMWEILSGVSHRDLWVFLNPESWEKSVENHEMGESLISLLGEWKIYISFSSDGVH